MTDYLYERYRRLLWIQEIIIVALNAVMYFVTALTWYVFEGLYSAALTALSLLLLYVSAKDIRRERRWLKVYDKYRGTAWE